MLMPFTVTTFSSIESHRGKEKIGTWPQLQARLCRPEFRFDKKAGSGWTPARFHSYPARRLQENVALMTLLVLDCDTEATIATAQGQAEALGIEALLHSTFSSTPDDRRARAVFPLAEPVPAAEWSAFWLRARRFFTNDQADPACKDANRFYWWLSAPTPETVWTWQHAGLFLTPEMVPLLPVSDPPLPPRLPVSIAPSSGESRPSPDVLLRMAVERLPLGRNESGLWLATQARDNGYSFAEVESLAWHQRVPREKPRPHGGVDVFDEREWQAIVANAFGKPARQPWAPLERSVPAARPRAAARASQRSEPPDPFADDEEPDWECPIAESPSDTHRMRTAMAIAEAMANGHQNGGEPVKAKNGGPDNDLLARMWHQGESNHFAFVEGDEWMRWNETHWGKVTETVINDSIYWWLGAETAEQRAGVGQTRLKEIRFLGQSLFGTRGEGPIPRTRFDANPQWLPVANGMLDVETRILKPHAPEHWNSYSLPYPYEPEATCPRFEQFLQQVMITETGTPCPEWREFLTQWMGYCLIPDCSAETVLVNIGEGGNGKSVWVKVLEGLVGLRNCGSIIFRRMELAEEQVMASLYGKLVCFINEPSPKALLSGGGEILKKLSSGDSVTARRLYHEEFNYHPYVRIIISLNKMLETRDLSHAQFRRPVPIEWRFRPPKPDRQLDKKLLGELPGILNLALEGLDRLRARGYDFEVPEESLKLRAEYQHSQDSAQQFIETCCFTNPDDRTDESLFCTAADLHRAYGRWCKDAGYVPMNLDAFGKHLTRRLGYPPGTLKKIDGKPTQVRHGIALHSNKDLYESSRPFGKEW